MKSNKKAEGMRAWIYIIYSLGKFHFLKFACCELILLYESVTIVVQVIVVNNLTGSIMHHW